MSESAPLNPEGTVPEAEVEESQAEESQVEGSESVDETQTEEPKAFDPEEYRKSLRQEMRQELQQERANTIRQLEKLLKSQQADPTEGKRGKLDSIMKRIGGVEGEAIRAQSPELADLLRDFMEESAATRNELESVRKQQTDIEKFERYMTGKPPGFRDAYVAEQERLMEQYPDASREALEIALGEFTKQFTEKAKAARPPAPKAPGVKRLVPTQGGATKVLRERDPIPFGG